MKSRPLNTEAPAQNGDGFICTQLLPTQSKGDGNSANSQRGPGQTGYHVDGHNHKDN